MIASERELNGRSSAEGSHRLVVKLLSLDREKAMDGRFPPLLIGLVGNFLMSVSLLCRPIILPLFVVGMTAIFIGIALAFARYDLVMHRTCPSSFTKAS